MDLAAEQVAVRSNRAASPIGSLCFERIIFSAARMPTANTAARATKIHPNSFPSFFIEKKKTIHELENQAHPRIARQRIVHFAAGRHYRNYVVIS